MKSWAEIKRLVPPRIVNQGSFIAIYAYAFRFGFRSDLVEDLKRQIPWMERSWDEDARTWYVTADWYLTLLALAFTCDEATLIDGNRMTDLHTGRKREQLDMFEEECP